MIEVWKNKINAKFFTKKSIYTFFCMYAFTCLTQFFHTFNELRLISHARNVSHLNAVYIPLSTMNWRKIHHHVRYIILFCEPFNSNAFRIDIKRTRVRFRTSCPWLLTLYRQFAQLRSVASIIAWTSRCWQIVAKYLAGALYCDKA